MSAPRSYSPFPQSPFMGDVLLIGGSGITGAQSLECLAAIPSGPLGPGFAKFVFDAVQLLRLGLPSQRCQYETAAEARYSSRSSAWSRRVFSASP